MKSQDRKYQHKQGETTWPRPHAGPHMVPKAYEYSLKPSQNRMFLNEKDQPTNRLCLMHYPPTVATFRSWRGSVACIAQNLLAGKRIRRERDSNPRYHCWYTPLPRVHLRPLGHLSTVDQLPFTKKSGGSEREGFEPSVPENQYTGFRVQLLRPLGHLSRLLTSI